MVELSPRMSFSKISPYEADTIFSVSAKRDVLKGTSYTVIDTPWAEMFDVSLGFLASFGLSLTNPEQLLGNRFPIKVANGEAEYEVIEINPKKGTALLKLIHGETWPIDDYGNRINETGGR
jgi:hypothetical protein